MAFSNTYFQLKTMIFLIKFHLSLSSWVQLTIYVIICPGNGLVLNRWPWSIHKPHWVIHIIGSMIMDQISPCCILDSVTKVYIYHQWWKIGLFFRQAFNSFRNQTFQCISRAKAFEKYLLGAQQQYNYSTIFFSNNKFWNLINMDLIWQWHPILDTILQCLLPQIQNSTPTQTPLPRRQHDVGTQGE